MNWFTKYTYAQKSIFIVLIFTVIRVVVSNFIGLGNDESYYYSYTHQLQINYFDHPPLVAIWLKIFTLNFWLGQSVFVMRLGSFVGCIMASLFMYKLVQNIGNPKASFIAVLLYNCSFYASVSAGLLVMPDTPQMVFFTASMYFITKIIKEDNSGANWIGFGLVAGLAVMSKVHAIFLWVGMGSYAIFYARHWFAKPAFYIAILLSAIIISPILIWNIQNDFITFRFHSERVIVSDAPLLNWYGLLAEIVGELVINNILNVVLIFIFVFVKKIYKGHSKVFIVFNLIAFPLLFCIVFLALFKQTLPHWSGPAYICLIPIAAVGVSNFKNAFLQKIFLGNFIYTLFIYVGLIYCVQYYAGTFSKAAAPFIGQGDISLDAYGWQQGGKKFKEIYYANCDSNKKYSLPIVSNTWWGAHDEYYFAKPLKIPVIGLGSIKEIHQYHWLNKANVANVNLDTSFAIVHSYDYYDAKKIYAKYYRTIDCINTITIYRNRKLAYHFYIYKLVGWRGVAIF